MAAQLKIDDRLHSGGGHEARLAETYLGMAHIAGTGPLGARCRSCRHWNRETRDWDRDTSKQAYCDYPISGKRRRLFPGSAMACRFHSGLEG